MATIRFKKHPLGAARNVPRKSSVGTSAAAKLIEVGIAFAGAESSTPLPRFCSGCWAPRDSHNSTARWPALLCSERCEQEFVRVTLACLTVEDCIRPQCRLEALIKAAEGASLRALAGDI